MLFVIDTREKAVLPFIDNEIKEFQYIQKQINTGDYLIINNNKILACFERKTYNDFAASFRDGRYSAGIEKMKKLRSETNCQLFFIIEGPAFPSINKKFSRIPYVCILGAINSLMINNNIFVIQTENEQHTAKRLNDFIKSYAAGLAGLDRQPLVKVDEQLVEVNEQLNNEQLVNEQLNEVDEQLVDKQLNDEQLVDKQLNDEQLVDKQLNDEQLVNKIDSSDAYAMAAMAAMASMTVRIIKTDDEIAIKSWASLKGISIVLGKLLCNKYSISDIETVSIEEIKLFKASTGKLANKHAINSILMVKAGNNILAAKMLAAVPGITVATSTYILKTINLSKLCKLSVTELETIMIPRATSECKLGKKAILLHTLLHYKNSLN